MNYFLINELNWKGIKGIEKNDKKLINGWINNKQGAWKSSFPPFSGNFDVKRQFCRKRQFGGFCPDKGTQQRMEDWIKLE